MNCDANESMTISRGWAIIPQIVPKFGSPAGGCNRAKVINGMAKCLLTLSCTGAMGAAVRFGWVRDAKKNPH